MGEHRLDWPHEPLSSWKANLPCGGRDKLDDIGADTVDVVTESLKSAGNSCCFLIAITVSMSGKLASCRFLTKIEEAGYLMPRPL